MAATTREHGFLSDRQFKVLQLRVKNGLLQAEVASILGTTRENVTLIEKKARRNIRLAKETLQAYRLLLTITKIPIEVGVHRMDIAGILVKAGDSMGVKLKVNFTRIYDEIRFEAGDCIVGNRVVKPFTIAIFRDGNIEVVPKLIE